MSDQNRREAFLNEMGLGPVWSQRGAAAMMELDDAPAPVIPSFVASTPVEKELRVAESPSSAWADIEPAKITAMTPAVTQPIIPVTDVAHMDWEQL